MNLAYLHLTHPRLVHANFRASANGWAAIEHEPLLKRTNQKNHMANIGMASFHYLSYLSKASPDWGCAVQSLVILALHES
jgi:hypothetical protein